MFDQHGRKIDYLRISITDRCNLRCIYCMPEEGVPELLHEDLLSYEEILRLTRTFAKLGIRKLKITGGEPLVRRGCIDFISQLKQVEGIEQVTITTNGVLLDELAEPLIQAGIDGINVSLDTVHAEIFHQITRRDSFDRVMAGIEKVQSLRYPNLKINCVPIVQYNREELLNIALKAKDYPLAVRFIELMPIGLGSKYTAVSKKEIVELLSETCGPLTPFHGVLGNGPAEYYSIPGFQGKIGFIGAVHNKFCGSCNRVRLTSNGFLKLCLNQNKGVELRPLLRGSCSDEELEEVIRKTVWEKPLEHHFYDKKYQKDKDSRMMFQVGG